MSRVEQPTRRRKHRRRSDGTGGAQEGAADRSTAEEQHWKWRTFPVAFAFAVGVFMMSWLAFVPGLNILLFAVSMVAVALGLAHIFVRQVVARRRRE